MRKLTAIIAAAAAFVLLAGPASAHVTVQPSNATQGTFSRFDVRVPNESPDDDTVKVEVQFPPNLVFVNFQPQAGWTRTVTMKTLDTPIVVFGTEHTEVIDTVTWEGGTIGPGEFQEFGFTARTPDDVTEIVFPAIQTYATEGGVAWIGPADADKPAPRVALAAAATETEPDATEPDATDPEPTETVTETESAEPTIPEVVPASGDTGPLSIIALIAGLVGLAFGGTALSRSRTES